MALCQTPEAAQQKLLMDILETNKDTAIGTSYDFAGIHSIADFQNKVPVSSWENIQDMAKAMEQGKKDQLLQDSRNILSSPAAQRELANSSPKAP